MLANILPGVREVRTPLIIGLVWIFSIVPLWDDEIEPLLKMGLPGISAGAALSSDWRPITIGVILFTAYIAGLVSINFSSWMIKNSVGTNIGIRAQEMPSSLVEPVSAILRRHISGRMNHANSTMREELRRRYEEIIDYFSENVPRATNERAYRELRSFESARDVLAGGDPIHSRECWDIYTRVASPFSAQNEIYIHLNVISHQIIGTEDKIYDLFDRERSEGDLRTGLALPIVATAFIWFHPTGFPSEIPGSALSQWLLPFYSQGSVALVLLLAIAASLFFLGFSSYRRSMILLANAVAADRIARDSMQELLSDLAIDHERHVAVGNINIIV